MTQSRHGLQQKHARLTVWHLVCITAKTCFGRRALWGLQWFLTAAPAAVGRYVTCEWKAAHLVRAEMAGLPLCWPPVGVSVLVKKLSFLGLIFFFYNIPDISLLWYHLDHEYKRDWIPRQKIFFPFLSGIRAFVLVAVCFRRISCCKWIIPALTIKPCENQVLILTRVL